MSRRATVESLRKHALKFGIAVGNFVIFRVSGKDASISVRDRRRRPARRLALSSRGPAQIVLMKSFAAFRDGSWSRQRMMLGNSDEDRCVAVNEYEYEYNVALVEARVVSVHGLFLM